METDKPPYGRDAKLLVWDPPGSPRPSPSSTFEWCVREAMRLASLPDRPAQLEIQADRIYGFREIEKIAQRDDFPSETSRAPASEA